MTFKVVLAVSYLLSGLFSMGFATYIMYTKLDPLEVYFKNNAMIMGCRRWWGGKSHRDRWMRLGLIGYTIMFPRLCIWRGLVTQQEIDAIPFSLRRWVKASAFMNIPPLLCLIVFGVSLLFQ